MGPLHNKACLVTIRQKRTKIEKLKKNGFNFKNNQFQSNQNPQIAIENI